MESFKRNSRHYRRRKKTKETVVLTSKSTVGKPSRRFIRKKKGKDLSTRQEENIVLKFGSFNVNGIDEASGGAIQDLLRERGFDVSLSLHNEVEA